MSDPATKKPLRPLHVLGHHPNGQRVVAERGRRFKTIDGLWWIGTFDRIPAQPVS